MKSHFRVWRAALGTDGQPIALVEDYVDLPDLIHGANPDFRWWKSAYLCAIAEDGGMEGCDGPCEPGSPCAACHRTAASWWSRWEVHHGWTPPPSPQLALFPAAP